MAELYQVIGVILRDISQARLMSDLYSRSISRHYEQDSLLRRFPVPRADITELEIDLNFAVTQVAADPARRDARYARISKVFEDYSSAVIRSALDMLKGRADKLNEQPDLTPDQRKAVQDFDATFLSTEYRQQSRSRLLRYFEDNQAKLIDSDGNFNTDLALSAIKQFIADMAGDTPEIARLLAILKVEARKAEDDLFAKISADLQSMHDDIHNVFASSREYKVEIEVDASKLAQLPERTISSVKIKSVVRNYTWSKVDTDPKDLRAVRKLVPEG